MQPPNYSPRQLSEADHRDIVAIASTGGTLYNVVQYANRPESEVRDYLLRYMPQTYEQLQRNAARKG